MSIERDLYHALRRKPAPDDLADRVLARLAPAGSASPFPRGEVLDQPPSRSARPGARWWLAAAAALALVATGGGSYYLEQQRLAEAERAAQALRLALQITSITLADAQSRVAASLTDRNR